MKDKKEIKLYFCPSCKSKEVGYIFTLRNLFGVIPKMQCKKCGYEAVAFPIMVVDLSKLGKKKRRRKR
jgi:DNA-directed RNA polymerase subunit M/transcription elongation factor TFIIS